jgi:hypothetical protein
MHNPSQIIISNILIHKCLLLHQIFAKLLRQMDLWDHSAPNCCAKSIFAINLRQKCAPNFVRVAVLRRRSFGNTPSNSPWENVEADENIEIFVAPSASRVCIQHLI